MRGMRGVGLVLVDERRRRVACARGCRRSGSSPACSTMQRWSAGGGSPGRRPCRRRRRGPTIERVVRLQRDDDRAAAALRRQVEAVVEELPEQREPRVERRRQADVGRDVRDDEAALAASLRRLARGRHGRRVARALVDDQVARSCAAASRRRSRSSRRSPGRTAARPPGPVDVARLALAEQRRDEPREDPVRRAELLLARDQVVERARRPCAARRAAAGSGSGSARSRAARRRSRAPPRGGSARG